MPSICRESAPASIYTDKTEYKQGEVVLYIRNTRDLWSSTGSTTKTLPRNIVVGRRPFFVVGGLLNMYLVVYIHRVCTWYVRYVYRTSSAARRRPKSLQWHPKTTVLCNQQPRFGTSECEPMYRLEASKSTVQKRLLKFSSSVFFLISRYISTVTPKIVCLYNMKRYVLDQSIPNTV